MGSEILQRQRVVRQRTEKGIRVAEGEVGGSTIITRRRAALRGKRRQGDSPENSRRLFIMPRGATRIPAQRLGKICGYSNSENSEGEMDRNKT